MIKRCACVVLLATCLTALADQVRVGVAANFAAPMKTLAAGFERASGHRALLSIAATGTLHAQVVNGAPFDVLLAADEDTPLKLEQAQLGVAGTRSSYAIGKLVLWSARPGMVDAAGEVLQQGRFAYLALANPSLAPYGAAAVQTMTRLGVLEKLRPRLVQGQSIGQTYSFIATGNAELGFIALSQVFANGAFTSGSGWIVPAALYHPLRQDAILLRRAQDKPAARALLAYLVSAPARAIIRSFGYALP